MQSLVDIVTTTFQAVLAVCVIFTAGYAYGGKNGAATSTVSLITCFFLRSIAESQT